jgi:hypothetical protein
LILCSHRGLRHHHSMFPPAMLPAYYSVLEGGCP